MYLITSFFAVFALGMAACTVYLIKKNRELTQKNYILSVNVKETRALLKHGHVLRKQLRRQFQQERRRVDNLQTQLSDSYVSLEMALRDNLVFRDPFKHVGVEIRRGELRYVFAREELMAPSDN